MLSVFATHRQHNASNPTPSSPRKTSTFWKSRAKSASTASPARCSIPVPCESCFPACEGSSARRRSHPRSRLLPDRRRRIQAAHHAAAAARPWQLRHLDQQFVKWLGEKVEEPASPSSPASPAPNCFYDGDRVVGVRTDDKGVDKENQPEIELRARLRSESQGHDPRRRHARLADQATHRANSILLKDRNPQTYGIGVKELWEVPVRPHRARRSHLHDGLAAHHQRIRRRLDLRIERQLVSLGFVTGLDYPDPRLDPQRVLQEFKKHPFIAALLDGGKMIRYGAKSMPYGGWWAMPPLAGDGWMILGDSAGFLNSQRLKGIHLAIKSGMLAAETAFEALLKNDFPPPRFSNYKKASMPAGSRTNSGKCATSIRASSTVSVAGMFHTGLQQITGGRGLYDALYSARRLQAHEATCATCRRRRRRAHLLGPSQRRRQAHVRQAHRSLPLRHASTKKISRRTSSFTTPISATTRCVEEYGNPCQNFCPANVYEMVDDAAAAERQAHPDQSVQLRALQDLRHHGPLPDHHLGPARRRRRAELRWDVMRWLAPIAALCLCVGSASLFAKDRADCRFGGKTIISQASLGLCGASLTDDLPILGSVSKSKRTHARHGPKPSTIRIRFCCSTAISPSNACVS